MKLFSVHGEVVNVDIRQSKYPVKAKSRSSLQGEVGSLLRSKYPYDVILEDFVLPGSRMSVDFFLPQKGIVVEVDGKQHDEFVPFFHGDKAASDKFAQQKGRDASKTGWCEMNDFNLIRVKNRMDLQKI
jgi:hypothetical protein